jgi:endo-1,3(4)-beta-glucanase
VTDSFSQDGWSAFVVKMWGKVTGDQAMEKRGMLTTILSLGGRGMTIADVQPGNLQLAVQARAFNNYFYLDSSNTNAPTRFRPNKVAGILFENKVDYASTSLHPCLGVPHLPTSSSLSTHSLPRTLNSVLTSQTAYFGSAPELIHGIHMVPISPPTSLLRPRQFVKEEWEAFFDNGRANVDGMSRLSLDLHLSIQLASFSNTCPCLSSLILYPRPHAFPPLP